MGAGGGAYHAIVGTLVITLLATAASVPIGIMAAVYLNEYGRGRLKSALIFFVDVMTGIPSIVAGLFAFALFALFLGPGIRLGVMGAVALSVLMIPIVVRSTEEMLKVVPNGLRESSYALGVPKWRTVVSVVLPTASAGIMTGVMVAVARVIGETAPLLITTGTFSTVNWNPFAGRMENLPVFSFSQYKNPGVPKAPYIERAWAAAFTSDYHRHGPESHRPHAVPAVRKRGQLMGTKAWRHRKAPPRSDATALPEGPSEQSPMTTTAPPVARGIEVSDLNLYYGGFHAVKDVSMSIKPNAVTAFIGSSGCGKSTMLRSLNRMHEVIRGARAEGTVLIDGQDIYAPNVDPVLVRRKVGMVFQAPNPFPTMSIYDNVAAGLKLNKARIGRDELDEIVERSLRGAHLWEEVKDRLDRPGLSLSGGQQQRLCIARAIAVEPEILLMDEPASALDPIATLAIEDLVSQLKEQYTIVIVTHNMQQASRASDYTAFFNIEATGMPGHLVEMDETATIFSRPAEKATEDYVSGRFG